MGNSLPVLHVVKPVIPRVMCLDVTSVRPMSLPSKEVARVIRAISKELIGSGEWARSVEG
jgi:hypothetical protein